MDKSKHNHNEYLQVIKNEISKLESIIKVSNKYNERLPESLVSQYNFYHWFSINGCS